MKVLKYIPTPAQLKRWKNEVTIIIAAIVALLVSLNEFIEPLSDLDPRIKGLSVVIAGLVQRWNAYGKQTVEEDLPLLEEVSEIDWAPDPLVQLDWTANMSSNRPGFRDLVTRSAREGDV